MTTEEFNEMINEASEKAESPGRMNTECASIYWHLSDIGIWGALLKMRMEKIALLQKILCEDVAHFFFEKQDGTSREAYGTRVRELIKAHGGDPDGNTQSAKAQKRPAGTTMSYFDLEKKDWRCFKTEKLKRIDIHYVTE